jgi:hypothetical protein
VIHDPAACPQQTKKKAASSPAETEDKTKNKPKMLSVDPAIKAVIEDELRLLICLIDKLFLIMNAKYQIDKYVAMMVTPYFYCLLGFSLCVIEFLTLASLKHHHIVVFAINST